MKKIEIESNIDKCRSKLKESTDIKHVEIYNIILDNLKTKKVKL